MLILQTANRPTLAHRQSHNLQNKNEISWMFEIRCLHLPFILYDVASEFWAKYERIRKYA